MASSVHKVCLIFGCQPQFWGREGIGERRCSTVVAAAMAEGASACLGEAAVNRPPDPGAALAERADYAERRAIRKAQRDAKRYRLIEKHVRNVVRRGFMRTRVKQAVAALDQASENLKRLGEMLDDASRSDVSEVFERSPSSKAGDTSEPCSGPED